MSHARLTSRFRDVATIAHGCIFRPHFQHSFLRTSRPVSTIGVMANAQGFVAGDFLVFQIESGFGLMRVLHIDDSGADPVWHVTVYRDLFPEIEYAELAIASPESLTAEIDHIALTDRAFESTQVSRLGNVPLTAKEQELNDDSEVSDRSIRLLLGLR